MTNFHKSRKENRETKIVMASELLSLVLLLRINS